MNTLFYYHIINKNRPKVSIPMYLDDDEEKSLCGKFNEYFPLILWFIMVIFWILELLIP